MKNYSKKGLERRKQEREGYADFYKKHVALIKDKKICCSECGERLIGDVSEVAHILEKNYFKSLALEDENIVYLCSWKSKNNCHDIFDDSNEKLQNMKVFQEVKQKVESLMSKIKEKINYKFYIKWQI